eukprot:gene5424-5657_t
MQPHHHLDTEQELLLGVDPIAHEDLLQAAEKALASGLGDWHLQMLQDISPHMKQHVLVGPLGPEALKHRHRMAEPNILQLYGLLHRHCTGFQQEVQKAVQGAADVEPLLAAVWVAFAQLWDECVRMEFQGEVLATMQELECTHATLLEVQGHLAQVQQENAALKDRCSEFVRANLDHMLAWRSLKAKADALESEVAMLSTANNEVSLRAAATTARNTQLTVQLEGLEARFALTQQQFQEREAGMAAARTAMLEKDSGLRRLDANVAALEQQLHEAGKAAKHQDDVIADLKRQLEERHQLVQDADRRVADKQRAYNLLHADFVKQKAEAAEMMQKAEQLHQQLKATQEQVHAADVLAAKAQEWQQRLEQTQMHVEDLQATNARAALRRHELVSSYWPVMTRLGKAEDAVQALKQQVQDLGHIPVVSLEVRDSRAADVEDTPAPAVVRSALPDSHAGNLQPQHQHAQASISNMQGNLAGSAGQLQGESNDKDGEHTVQQTQRHQQQGTLYCLPEDESLRSRDNTTGSSHPGLEQFLKEELQQLRDNYLLLQDAYWQQKEQLMALELQTARLQATTSKAIQRSMEADAALAAAQQDAAQQGAMRLKLEADVVGCKSWIRELEQTEQKYLKSLRDQGALEDACTAAQRQADEARTAQVAAEAACKLAQAKAKALDAERQQLLQEMAQHLNKSTLIEQAIQKAHKQEMSSSRAACSRLQDVVDQQAAELAKANAQLSDVRCCLKDQQSTSEQHKSQSERCVACNERLMLQVQQAHLFLTQTLQRVGHLEDRISLLRTTSGIRGGDINQDAATHQSHLGVEVAAEAAVHLMDRLLVTLQCWAADAGTISNAAAASKVEVLVQHLMHGLEVAASKASRADTQGVHFSQTSSWQQEMNATTHLGVLRSAVSTKAHQRLQELERQLPVMQIQLADGVAQMQAAESARVRLERALQVKCHTVESTQQQLAVSQSQVQQLHKTLARGDWQLQQMQQELTSARLQLRQAEAASVAQSSELQAVNVRARNAEVMLEQQQTMAAEAAAANAGLLEQLQKAVEASRRDVIDQKTASSAAAAAHQQLQHLQAELTAANARITELQNAVKDSWQRADICTQSAREAQFKAVQTQTLLADARRELDFTQHCLAQMRQDQEVNKMDPPAAAAVAAATGPASVLATVQQM